MPTWLKDGRRPPRPAGDGTGGIGYQAVGRDGLESGLGDPLVDFFPIDPDGPRCLDRQPHPAAMNFCDADDDAAVDHDRFANFAGQD
jgi:hypothetical protein